MAEKRNPLGATGEAVRANIAHHRERLNLKFADVSRRLDGIGRPIPVLGLSRIEKGERRIDADDLMALAVALEVSPATLLMPNYADDTPDTEVQATGFVTPVAARQLWDWLRADRPLPAPGPAQPEDRGALIKFLGTALPYWRATEIAEGMRTIAAMDHEWEQAVTPEQRDAFLQKHGVTRASDGDD